MYSFCKPCIMEIFKGPQSSENSINEAQGTHWGYHRGQMERSLTAGPYCKAGRCVDPSVPLKQLP